MATTAIRIRSARAWIPKRPTGSSACWTATTRGRCGFPSGAGGFSRAAAATSTSRPRIYATARPTCCTRSTAGARRVRMNSNPDGLVRQRPTGDESSAHRSLHGDSSRQVLPRDVRPGQILHAHFVTLRPKSAGPLWGAPHKRTKSDRGVARNRDFSSEEVARKPLSQDRISVIWRARPAADMLTGCTSAVKS